MGQGDNQEGEMSGEQAIQFSSIIAEADVLMRLFQYSNAEKLYTKALGVQPKNIHVLICRSRCRALNGNPAGSLQDADAILKIDPKNFTGLLCKADALFAEGDFENAMVWYYRGQAIRPDHDEFAHGIIRSQVAIERALNAFDVEKLKSLRQNDLKQNAFEKEQQKKKKATSTLDHNLLEELYQDYCFLKELKDDQVFGEGGQGQVKELVSEAVHYLDDRIEFWRARNPKGVHDVTVLEQTTHSKTNRGYRSYNINKHAVLPSIKKVAV